MDKQDTEETIVPLFLDKVGQSPQIPTPQESLSDLMGLQLKTDAALISLPQVTLEESEEAIKVASKYLSSRLVFFKSQITLMAKVIILVS